MAFSTLTSLSPLDGRYHHITEALRPFLSEYALIRYRMTVEIHWLLALSGEKSLKDIPKLSSEHAQSLLKVIENFSLKEADGIKNIEKMTNHDVKAVEYGLQQYCKDNPALEPLMTFIHFGCTSEDINNLSYSMMLNDARRSIILPKIESVALQLQHMAMAHADLPMLSRTHGQPATPSTLGKEWANFVSRISNQFNLLKSISFTGKINGAVGNFNAHNLAYPEFNWIKFSHKFIQSLGLVAHDYTTQIEPHDTLAEWLHALIRLNNILIDLCRDIWGYISLGYLQQSRISTETGSSTMPHKINPIDFENAEGNLGLSNAMADHLANKLPISRWQRDLSDSTVMRNLGTILGYALIAYDALFKGLNKVKPNEAILYKDLDDHWEVLAEALQTVMRRYHITAAYEQLKTLTRGEYIDQEAIKHFIEQLPIPSDTKQRLLTLTPRNYLGYAATLAKRISWPHACSPKSKE